MYNIVIGIFSVIFTVLNIVRLARSARLLKALRRDRFIKTSAKIVRRSGVIDRDVFSTRYAKAEYLIDGKMIEGRLFAPVRVKLIEGQPAEVIVASGSPKMFACSEKHIKNAFVKYAFLTALTSAMAIFCVVFELWDLIHGIP